MSVLTDSLTGSAMLPLNTSVQVLAPATGANPHFTGATALDWSNPTVTATVLGRLQPAGTRALERTGRVGKHGVHELVTRPTTITPLGRVRVGAQQYSVLDARAFPTHTRAVIEEVSA
ncbi:MAG: hypothetical protein H0X64_13520 [Gemmatimonadaceae bacterium]|nr:hypothetical protein [Gemmatimonadaceae bacterium]